MRARLASAAILPAFVLGCDIEGTQHDQPTGGPVISVLGTSIEANDGVIAADGVIQVAFDRYLLPATVARQSFAIVDSTNTLIPAAALRSVYDPVARTVTITGPDGPGEPWLIPEQSYKLVLLIPDDPASDIGGFRAIDRAPLAPQEKRQFVFRTGAPQSQKEYEPSATFCSDVMPIFHAKCASCHSSSHAAAALVLDSSEGVRATAIRRLAQGSNTGGRPDSILPSPSKFGLNMPVIMPGDPGSSWLIYKTELAPPPPAGAGPVPNIVCEERASSLSTAKPRFFTLAPARPIATEAERQILGEYVLGREMPYPYAPEMYVPPAPTDADPHPTAYFYTSLDFEERERLRIWITRGAKVDDCAPCRVLPRPDGDSADAGR